MNPQTLYCIKSILIFLTGASFASFFTTLSLRFSQKERLPLKEILFTRSHCDSCGRGIPAAYLFPVAGYFFSRGKCPSCGQRIFPVYPLTELAGGITALMMVSFYGFSLHAMTFTMLLFTGASLSYIDMKTMTIPDLLVGLILFFAILYRWNDGTWLSSLYGALAGGGIFIIILLLFPGSFGGGDVKLAAALGFTTGLELLPVFLETALVSGAMAGIIYGVATKKGLRSMMPFGPFLILAMVVTLTFGQEMLLYYMSLF